MWEYKALRPNILLSVHTRSLFDVVKGKINIKIDLRNTEEQDEKLKGNIEKN